MYAHRFLYLYIMSTMNALPMNSAAISSDGMTMSETNKDSFKQLLLKNKTKYRNTFDSVKINAIIN